VAQDVMRSEAQAHGKLSILIVDDVAHNRELVGAFLEAFPWRLEYAADGEEAIRCCASKDYDLVLMDIQMPGMDGFEATRRIRDGERAAARARTPIVALTAHAMSTDVQRCLQAGCDGHVPKPITRAALTDAIETYARHPSAPFDPHPRESAGASAAEPPMELEALIPQYLADCQARVAEVLSAIDHGDFEQVARHAHNLRGSGSSFGFPPEGSPHCAAFFQSA
jgi:CheY-like chemotaxis protein